MKLFAFALSFMVFSAFAQVSSPTSFTYNGRLTDNTGAAILSASGLTT